MKTIRYNCEYESPYGCFSNFTPIGFELDGVWWPSAEHCYHCYKFNSGSPEHQDARRSIYMASTPHDAKRIAHSFDSRRRYDWEIVRDDVMRRVVLRKFEANPAIAKVLLSTDDAMLVEASSDYHWGCGENGMGENMLGKVLMDVRERIRLSAG